MRKLLSSPAMLLVISVLAIAGVCPTAQAGSSNSLMDISSDGLLLACSNRDSGTVTIVDLKTHKTLREIPIGQKPEGVSFLGNTHRLAVAAYHDDKVVFLDGDSGQTLGDLAVFDEPYGVVSNAAGDRIYVTLSYPGQVLEIDAEKRSVLRTLPAGPFVRGLALAPDESRLYVTEYYTANVLALDLPTGKIVDHWNGITSDNLARQIIVHPTRNKAYFAHIRSAVEQAHGEGSIFPYVTVLDTQPATSEKQKRRKRIPMDSFIGVDVTANPWEVAISGDGKRFFSLFSGTNDLYACDVLDDDYREIRYRKTLRLGHNPRAVRVSPDNETFYVYNALDFNVVAYDVKTLAKRATIEVTRNPMSDEALAGKRLFYSALQPMSSREWIACSSCHVDGENDGRTWQNPEGLRDTPSLAGLAWTHPIHWSADRDEVQDFEHTIRGQLMQGRGLVRDDVHPDLGESNKGLSPDLDALAAYSVSHKPVLSPHAKSGLSESAFRGRELFFSESTKCASCHSGPYFTDSTPRETVLRHNVGTGNADPSEKMGSAYDTPTLIGVYKTAPYLHHGKAATLSDVLTTFNPDDRHGTTRHLSKAQVDDLVEFLRALPYEDPEPQAISAKMKKIER